MPINTKTLTSFFAVLLLLQGVALSGCSGNGFHLRENIDLPKVYQNIRLEGLSSENDFTKAFQTVLEEAGGESNNNAKTSVNISNFKEGKRVVAYTSQRKARIYLVFLKLEYVIQTAGASQSEKQRINLDRTFIYDSNFALGKAEEEKKIRKDLQTEAARLIILRLQYTNVSPR